MKDTIYKYRLELIIILLVLFNICVVIKNNDKYIIKQQVMLTSNNEEKIEMKDNKKYEIIVYYPKTEYKLLNDSIKEEIIMLVDQFKNSINSLNPTINQHFTLNIYYSIYCYKNLVSYVFYIEDYTGGNHPNNRIKTISYDKDLNKIITIDDLIKEYSNILENLSIICRDKLMKNPKITDTNILIGGTAPKIENFKNFAFSDDGLIIFFPHYQIAAYSEGSFFVKVQYNDIFI